MPTHSINNQPLAKPLRTQLEHSVKAAREVAEKGAHATLTQVAVGEAKAPDYLTDELKTLRRRLRAHGRALGDVKASDDTQDMRHLVWEVSYEHWHRMLFARFLAENGLLLWEPGAAVSLDDCEALVQEADPAMNLAAKTKWELAGKLAARMLPQVFKPQSPVFELALAPEHQRELERLLAALPSEVFKASDSLGWVYQFWQAKRKDEVNASEVKIGADELPAVTQLFTEPYMVDFLLHNSLGAWWLTRHPGQPCPVPLTYLRRLDDGTPAAGMFEGWPSDPGSGLQDFKLLDPCCGSGHFLVAAFLLLVPMRMADEGLSATDAVDAVLADNLHGLELDARCVEIAVFALALAAWRYPDENGNPLGVRTDMPVPNVACCGLKISASAEEWEALVPLDDAHAELTRQELRHLHSCFAQAPLLGSLLDPERSLGSGSLGLFDFTSTRVLLERALTRESSTTTLMGSGERDDEVWDLALTARGLLDAARLLDMRYHFVVTNVPYLVRGKHSEFLRKYCEKHYPAAKNDLATVFIERCHALCLDNASFGIVSPQNWWFLQSYVHFRKWLLSSATLNSVVSLGEEAWEYFGDRGPLATLVISTRAKPTPDSKFSAFNAFKIKTLDEKRQMLASGEMLVLNQQSQINNPDSRIALEGGQQGDLLSQFAFSSIGLSTSDTPLFVQFFWEHESEVIGNDWELHQSAPDSTQEWAGLECVVRYEGGEGLMRQLAAAQDIDRGRDRQGINAWGQAGVAVRLMRDLPVSLYVGNKFDNNIGVLVPHEKSHVAAIWCYCSSDEYASAIRRIDQKLNVTNGTLTKVPFDLEYWTKVANERYPDGFVQPYSDDPTQWLFHGHPQPATEPLQVAVARLVGYRWPAETDKAMALADKARSWTKYCDELSEHTDDDGIVCLPGVRGEPSAHERLLKLLIAAWETVQPGSWKPAVLDKLLTDADCVGKSLDVWLRDKFFEQHAKRFYHRPFIWHVWDGLKDGFAALVNYHKLDAKNLERLVHTYLGDWIRQQEAGVRDGIDGAPTRLAAAQDLKRRLELILEGEKPYDIFVRWKSLAEQPIGWNPDLNDGIRLNIRPFLTAEVLRHNKKPKLNITWEKDRGKDVESAPWLKVFGGDRINDYHLTVAEKKKARGDAS
ncbi:restriction endonuclease subunit M [Janthinobacterium sp. BJB301]|uniref:Eco57I restriction-modification methylase domain-containing protein n=1 Tax=Janthinobacterium sp. BJB301 TaxID=1560195 RepID=UPI000C0CE433|nr:DNA methyltransferase [Janthinobacterium sp. BJB301]PHV48378.1 restriction endonuclease subunit M [Janthinobacterium sp. BJB301]